MSEPDDILDSLRCGAIERAEGEVRQGDFPQLGVLALFARTGFPASQKAKAAIWRLAEEATPETEQ